MTHGAILLDWNGPVPSPGAATAGCRDEAMAPMTATKAAKRSSEEKTRRQPRCSGVNVEVVCEFVIMGLADGFGLIRDRNLKLRFLTQGGARCQTFSSGFHGFGRCAAQAKRGPLKGGTRYPLSFCRGSRAGCNNVDFAGDTPATTDPQVGNTLSS